MFIWQSSSLGRMTPRSNAVGLTFSLPAATRRATGRALFTLSVPTGRGKTLASLAFALEHVVRHGLDRVIYVIPYTSIIEQNAKVFRDALSDDAVLEHHSVFIDDPKRKPEARERLKLAMEDWDAAVVVTTAVAVPLRVAVRRPAWSPGWGKIAVAGIRARVVRLRY